MNNVENIINNALNSCKKIFEIIDSTALINQEKVLDSFRKNNIALRHFAPTSGYGYDDIGRDTLGKVFADIFETESGIVSPLLTSGTHALTVGLFGVLRPNDTLLCITGKPYDTLTTVISGGNGSLSDFGIKFQSVSLTEKGDFDYEKIQQALSKYSPKVVYLQRSRGYEWRSALSIEQIENVCKFLKEKTSACIMVDNCYGEFVATKEPTAVGADVCIGSLIKNIGGGISPTGGYIVGKTKYIDLIAGRLTAPSIGMEVGSFVGGYRDLYQGVFLAPHVTAQALKTATLFCTALNLIGYNVKPAPNETFNDIVCSIKFNNAEKLIKFCQSIQYVSPIDSFVTPEPWEMPGYNDKVIMSAGCFVQGASIELSCDAPIRPPYIAYLQGGLTFEHGIIALKEVLKNIL